MKKNYTINQNKYHTTLTMYENGRAVGGYSLPANFFKEIKESAILKDLKKRGYKEVTV